MVRIAEIELIHLFLKELLSQSEESVIKLKDTLHPQVEFKVIGKRASGQDAVGEALKNGPNSQLMQQLIWQEPRQIKNHWLLEGRRQEGTLDRGLIITLKIENGQVVLVQQQKTAPPPPAALPLAIPQELKTMINNALVERHPILMAYCDLENQPVQTFRGSLQVFSDTQLAMRIRSPEGAFVKAIEKNPKVSFVYRNEETKATYSFQGKAKVSDSEADREIVYERSAIAEQDHDFAKLGVVVLVDLEKIEGYSGLGPGGQMNQIKLIRQN
jgi:hypothetical protein